MDHISIYHPMPIRKRCQRNNPRYMTIDIQEPIPTGEKTDRRGLPFIETAADIREEKRGQAWATKYINFGAFEEMFIRGSRECDGEEPTEYYGDSDGYTIDSNGEIKEMKATEFHNKGFYEMFAHCFTRDGVGQGAPDLKINLWIGDGLDVSGMLEHSDTFDEKTGTATGGEYDTFFENNGKRLFLPKDPDLLKKLRFNIQTIAEGGGKS